MTQDEFEKAYAARSGMSMDAFRRTWIGLPCKCGKLGCEGWAAVPRDPEAIAGHLAFYAPGTNRMLRINQSGFVAHEDLTENVDAR